MTAHLVAEESPAERTAPHNDYIGVFAEMGVPGLALMVAIQIGVLRSLLRAARGLRGAYRDHVVIIGLLFVGINVLGALNNPLYFFDVEIAIWSLVGAALTVPAYLASSRSAMEASADTAAVGS